MKIGVTLRNMGPQSRPDWLSTLAERAEELGFESLWVTDHVAIPPDDAEGSEGRYLDTLTTLSWLAGHTSRIRLGSGVLILPYRPILPVAKQVATLQELSGGRLVLGVGVGWMPAEFKALGVPRGQRGALTDHGIEFLQHAFAQDQVSANGQSFLFKPRPQLPELLIGGAARYALPRALRFNIGWIPMVGDIEGFATQWADYRKRAASEGQQARASVMTGVSTVGQEAPMRLGQLAELEVTRVICALRYNELEEGLAELEGLAEIVTRGGLTS